MLKKVADEFLEEVKIALDTCVILDDVERLDRLFTVFRMYVDGEIIRDIRKKGLANELRDLCEKAGSKLKDMET